MNEPEKRSLPEKEITRFTRHHPTGDYEVIVLECKQCRRRWQVRADDYGRRVHRHCPTCSVFEDPFWR